MGSVICQFLNMDAAGNHIGAVSGVDMALADLLSMRFSTATRFLATGSIVADAALLSQIGGFDRRIRFGEQDVGLRLCAGQPIGYGTRGAGRSPVARFQPVAPPSCRGGGAVAR